MEENRIIETTDLPGDSWQYSLRPHYLREYIGQDKVKDNLEVFIKAAKLVNDEKSYQNFCNLMEALVAYHKYYGGKD